MAEGIRQKAIRIMEAVPVPIASDKSPLFSKYAHGTTHQDLVDAWDKGSQQTTCMDFVGWYGIELGMKEYIGGFDLKGFMQKAGKPYAWVPSTEDARPKRGDICRHTAYHVGLSFDIDDEDVWTRLDSGQGGRGQGRDIINRVRDVPYDWTKLQGWIDIELYFGGPPSGPVPPWLLGWWKVTWRGQTYYYFFDRNRQVKYTKVLVQSSLQPPLAPDDTGTVRVESTIAVTVTWGATGSVEKFYMTADDKMQGRWNDREPLDAEKL